MRVGFDITPLAVPPSGIGTYTDCLLDHLQQNGDVIVPLSHFPAEYRWSSSDNGNRPKALNKTAWMQFGFSRRVKELQLDVCHFTNSVAPVRPPCPTVITIHDMTLWLYPAYHPRRRIVSMRPIIPIAARKAAAIIAVSENTKEDIVKVLKVPEEKIMVIHEAPHPSFKPMMGSPELVEARIKFDLPERFILHVGTLEPRKNLVGLLEAMAVLHHDQALPHKLVLVGKAGWSYEEVFAAVERLGLRQAVRFLDYVPDRWLPAIYNLAKALVFPSHYEGFGLPVVEAMACGTAVITSAKGALEEVAGDAAMYLDPDDTNDMIRVIRQTLTDEKLLEELKHRGLKRAGKFNWARAAEETRELYKKVASKQQMI